MARDEAKPFSLLTDDVRLVASFSRITSTRSTIRPTPAMGGGARRDRTDDLMLAKHALSQLSYGPWDTSSLTVMVGLGRLELPTSRLSSARSNQLSYKPEPDHRRFGGTEGRQSGQTRPGKKEKRRRRSPA